MAMDQIRLKIFADLIDLIRCAARPKCRYGNRRLRHTGDFTIVPPIYRHIVSMIAQQINLCVHNGIFSAVMLIRIMCDEYLHIQI